MKPGIAGSFLLSIMAAAPLLTHAAPKATTPIEHVIVLVGENRTFDNLYGVYKPAPGQTIWNLLSQGIVREDGSPGPRYAQAAQRTADMSRGYRPDPAPVGAYQQLPQPYAAAAFGQQPGVPDARFPAGLPNGPFQLTKFVSAGAHTGDPVHRFYQMWQQVNGGKNDLFVWTAEQFGVHRGGEADRLDMVKTKQGGVAMGFYNMLQGDAPYFRELAERYALADNYHQSIMGGTAPNYLALATADVATYNAAGKKGTPPKNQILQLTLLKSGMQVVENGGSYVNCSDESDASAASIKTLLKSLPYRPFNDGNCDADTYYMVNNLDPGYTANGAPLPLGADKGLLPPQDIPTIGDVLTHAGVPWKWYSGGRNDGKSVDKEYCGMCDTLTFFRSTMTGPDLQKLQDLQQFYVDVKDAKSFPAVSVIAPYDSISGHPGYATATSFEELAKDVVERVKANPELWAKTAILITFDEGGGYYDSGYVQFIDFFGDGSRIPLIAVSPYARRGAVDHTYYDHASIVKFIQRNWNLPKLSARSRDNLPNPVHDKASPYVPTNRPAIGDLIDLFDFKPRAAGKGGR